MEEWGRIESSKKDTIDGDGQIITRMNYNSPITGAFKLDFTDERIFIHFTRTVFKTLTGRLYLKTPYSRATDFLDNISNDDNDVKVENSRHKHKVRMGTDRTPLDAYTISVRRLAETG
jgi:hypothetical protein